MKDIIIIIALAAIIFEAITGKLLRNPIKRHKAKKGKLKMASQRKG